MEKKNFLLVCTMLAVATCVHAQRGWYTGVKGGVSIPTLRAPQNSTSYSSGFQTILGPQAGILGEFRFNRFFSLQAEVNYSTQGGEKHGDQRIRTSDFKAYIPAGVSLPSYLYANFSNRITLTYIEVPVMPRFSRQLSNRLRLSLYGGPYIGYLFKADGEASGKSRIYTDPERTKEFTYNGFALGEVDFNRKEDIISELNRFNYGLTGATALEYNAGPLNYFFNIGGSYGLNRLQKDKNFGNNKTGGLNVCIGLTHLL